VFYNSDGQTESHSFLIPVENKNGFSLSPDSNKEEYGYLENNQLIPSEF
jgi:hypothetical protein